MSHPFRFYGARPGDWFEGANCGHMWEVQFAGPPDAAARLRIAEAFGRAAGANQAIDCTCEGWRWLGDWTLVTLGEQVGGDTDAFWEAVQAVWTAVHAAVPISEIHFGGTSAPFRSDGWSQWSVAQKAVPGPAPSWGEFDLNLDIYGGQIQRQQLGDGSEDAAFEAARAGALAASKA